MAANITVFSTKTAGEFSILLKRGFYSFQLYGARGGGALGGKGGFCSGELMISDQTRLYMKVGGQGQADRVGGFNGGGNGGLGDAQLALPPGGGGGGSTDIRLNETDIYTRIIVAGGGGGACGNNWSVGGAGGGITGGISPSKDGSITLPAATQSGGYMLFRGQNAVNTFNVGSATGEGDGGGGSGLWGGNANQKTTSYNNAGGSGGSSYISGHSGCTIHSSNYKFVNTKMEQGINVGDGKLIIQQYILGNHVTHYICLHDSKLYFLSILILFSTT